MIHDFILIVTTWITNHPQLAGLTIFISSFAESLAFVGLIMPGAALMLTAGALIANNALSFWPTMGWVVSGAVLADGFSYWLGFHFKERIRAFSLFAKHPEVLERGEAFFYQHGGKSVFLGRFIGPVRPIIPLVAGMLGMERSRFTIYNFLSALCWAPAYLLPGMAFGASLALAGEVAGRLAILLVVLLLLFWFVFSFSRKIFLLLIEIWPPLEKRLLQLRDNSPFVRRLLGRYFSENVARMRLIIVLSLLLITATWLFGGITQDVIFGDTIVQSGKSLYHFLQGLRTPWGDTIMVGITMLGDAKVIIPLSLTAFAWLLWQRKGDSALFFAIATIFGFLLVTLTKNLTKIPRPVDMYGGAVHWAFPSSHATMSLIVFGSLALLCGQGRVAKKRWLPFASALFLILCIGYSRLYLGAHWLSDVVGGFSLGTAWLIVMTIVYLRKKNNHPIHGLVRICVITFIISSGVHWYTSFTENIFQYQIQHSKTNMTSKAWLNSGWQQLPAFRLDMAGEKEQKFNLQYAGSLEPLKNILLRSGWQQTVSLTFASSLRWLLANPSPQDLPILPQVNDGHHESLLMIHKMTDEKEKFYALRLWSADIVLDNGDQLWLGTFTIMKNHHYIKLLHLPRTIQTVEPNLLQTLSKDSVSIKQTISGPVFLIHSLLPGFE